ncbi:MAG: hypothetical protein AB9Q17_00430 [Candidatus Reddybacter sp.]
MDLLYCCSPVGLLLMKFDPGYLELNERGENTFSVVFKVPKNKKTKKQKNNIYSSTLNFPLAVLLNQMLFHNQLMVLCYSAGISSVGISLLVGEYQLKVWL